MQNIKNFQLVDLTSELREQFSNPEGDIPLILKSEEGVFWHECYDLFADDTVKIQYDMDGIICGVIDAPVPQRGDIYAVSMLWPVGQSVAEVALSDYPSNVVLDGTWKFDGIKIYRDDESVSEKTLATNTKLRSKYLTEAAIAICTIQCSAAVDNPRDSDTDDMLALQEYVDKLRGMTTEQLQQSPALFPTAPASIF